MNRFFISLVVVFVVISSFFPSVSFAVSLMAFGDSITQGLWAVQTPGHGRRIGGYEPHLERLFSENGMSAQVYNWGLGGETTKQAITGEKVKCVVDSVGVETCEVVDTRTLDTVLNLQHADYMLLMEGTNDFFSGISSATTAFNLGVMVDKIRARNMVPIVANLTPDERGTGKEIHDYNAAIAEMTARKDVLLVDVFSALIHNWGAYVSSDGLHPNDNGYCVIAQEWFQPFYNLQLKTGIAEILVQGGGNGAMVTLYGTAHANGTVSDLAFQYGTDESMQETVPADPVNGDAGKTIYTAAKVTGLEYDTTYYYRIVALQGDLHTYGETKTLVTGRRPALGGMLLLLLSN